MKILAVTFDSELSGGANRSFLMVITELKNRFQHDVRVIVPNHGPLETELIKNEISFECVEMKPVGVLLGNTPKRILSKLKANWLAYDHYVKAIKYTKQSNSHEFDLVYINCANNLFGCFVAKELKIPYVWHFRGAFVPANYYVHNQIKLYNDPKARIIAISNAMKNRLHSDIGINKSKLVMIHNGLPQGHVKLAKQEWQKGVHMLLCGRIVKGKGHLDAICALGELKKSGYDNIYLHIAGDVANANVGYRNALNTAIDDNQITDHVIFEGQIADMPAFRENMNIELICSECEPFGRVTVEGMRSGLVVIGSNTGGTLDIIQDGVNGLLYRQGSGTDLADKVRYVVENRDYAMSLVENAIAFSKTHFTMEENVNAIHSVLCEAVKL